MLGRRKRKLIDIGLPMSAGVMILVICTAITLYDPIGLIAVRNLVFDSYQRLKPREYTPVPVRILDIDEDSLARYGQWPWSRTTIRDIVAKLQDQQAAAIVFDIVFAEKDRLSPQQLLDDYRDVPGAVELVENLPDHDTVLAEQIAQGRVVTAFALTGPNYRTVRPRIKRGFSSIGDDPTQYLPGFQGAVPTIPTLEVKSAGNGAINFVPEIDGVVRKAPIALTMEGQIYPSLVTEALRVAQGKARMALKSTGASSDRRMVGIPGMVAARIGQITVETGRDGQIFLHHTRPVEQRTIPIWKYMQTDDVPESAITGNIVLIGTSAAGLIDLRFSPLGGVRPGVEMHAQAIEQALTGDYLLRPDWAKGAEVAFLFVLGTITIVCATVFGALPSAIIGGSGTLLAVLASWVGFSEYRFLIDPFSPAIFILASFSVTASLRYLLTERKQKFLRRAFSSYVPNSIVEHLVSGEGQLKLGGERRELTLIFTDLAGFTSLVESYDNDLLMPLLNQYLDDMIGIVFEYGGTLDKIIGDALAVMFSAPVEQPDHAERAIQCALALDRYARAFKQEQNENGIPFGQTRIGVNTGYVVVGNFGGNRLFDYTAYGDAINTAARLESVNKHLGTRICISERTVAKCPSFVGRRVAGLVLKGKKKPTTVHQPLQEHDDAYAWREEYEVAYEHLLNGRSEEARIVFASLDEKHPGDPLVSLHLHRLREDPHADATIVMSSK